MKGDFVNSFISWVGGKKLLRKYIINEFPEDYKRYVEVFGGAGWVLFGLEHIGKTEIYNDKDSDLVNLFRCMKYHCNELQRGLSLLLNSREQFYCFKDQMSCSGFTDIQRAARFYILIKHSFGSKIETFSSNKASNMGQWIGTFPMISERLARVIIENKDYNDIITSYDKEDTMFYLDPPYYGAEDIYKKRFSQSDHINLHDMLLNINGKFILSYNDNAHIRELYSGFNIIEIERQNNLSSNENNKRYKELIIKNF